MGFAYDRFQAQSGQYRKCGMFLDIVKMQLCSTSNG